MDDYKIVKIKIIQCCGVMDTAVIWRLLVQSTCDVCGAPHSNQCINTNTRLRSDIIIYYNHCNTYQSNFPI